MLTSKDHFGTVGTITTLVGDKIEFQYVVIDVTALVVSNHLNGAINESYPQDLQPRNRTTPEAVNKLERFSHNIEFSKLNASKKTDIGAPIIGADLVVESGNGRVMALTKAYFEGNAAEYRYQLYSLAKRFGIAKEVVESMKRPALVRLRLTDVDRAKFAKDCNADEEQSQNEDLADNGRMFEAVSIDELNTKGRGLCSFMHSNSASEIKRSIVSYAGDMAIQSANDPAKLYLGLVADSLKSILNTPKFTVGQIEHVGTLNRNLTKHPDIELSESQQITGLITSELGLSKDLNYDELVNLMYVAARLLNSATAKKDIEALISGNLHPISHQALLEVIYPVLEYTGFDQEQLAMLITKVMGVAITDEQLAELLTLPDTNLDVQATNKELFPEETKAFIESVYADIPKEVDMKAVFATYENLMINTVPMTQMLIDEHGREGDAIRQAAIWGKVGRQYNDAVDKFNKTKSQKKRDLYDEQMKALKSKYRDPDSPEAQAYCTAMIAFYEKGITPKASEIGLNALGLLLTAKTLSQNEQSKAAMKKVDELIAERIGANSSLPKFTPAFDRKSIASKIARFNRKDAKKQVESLDNALAYSDGLNKLIADNLPKNIKLDFTKYRAHFLKGGENGGIVDDLNIGDGKVSTMWHELGHSIEYQYPAIKKLAIDFLIKRYTEASAPKVIRLNSVSDNFSLSDDEIAVSKYTFSMYAMKTYFQFKQFNLDSIKAADLLHLQATEVISVAFELLSTPRGIAKLMSDKEHFSIAIAAMDYLKEKRS